MKRYVAGFCFNEALTQVVLIEKNHPDWQKGKFNGIGGHVEPGEHSVSAMVREFYEEAGVKTRSADWRKFCVLTGKTEEGRFEVRFYVAISNRIFNAVWSKTDEFVSWFRADDLGRALPNLKWLIPLALDKNQLSVFAEEKIGA